MEDTLMKEIESMLYPHVGQHKAEQYGDLLSFLYTNGGPHTAQRVIDLLSQYDPDHDELAPGTDIPVQLYNDIVRLVNDTLINHGIQIAGDLDVAKAVLEFFKDAVNYDDLDSLREHIEESEESPRVLLAELINIVIGFDETTLISELVRVEPETIAQFKTFLNQHQLADESELSVMLSPTRLQRISEFGKSHPQHPVTALLEGNLLRIGGHFETNVSIAAPTLISSLDNKDYKEFAQFCLMLCIVSNIDSALVSDKAELFVNVIMSRINPTAILTTLSELRDAQQALGELEDPVEDFSEEATSIFDTMFKANGHHA